VGGSKAQNFHIPWWWVKVPLPKNPKEDVSMFNESGDALN